ncbi:hypothetical protein M2137_000720 [Parabacteroides sp. PFB2-10]|uniref:DUF4861 domain-containing protein n=1 Tax=Parabacteroides sp. PFB2-10 TaxID=1742405 RepID=UPI002473775F|nr:DUF4861 domain-containing protein [Parabacteroides sp. PFB2-10]MDH6311957.1 hypothetical protein [Parabacteroides sp. PFB2-10]
MKTHRFFLRYPALAWIALFISSISLQAQEHTLQVEIRNDWQEDRTDAPVVIDLAALNLSFPVQSALVKDGYNKIPSQIDDLDQDGIADQICVVTDIPAQSTRLLWVNLSATKSKNPYPSRVFAEMLMRGDNGKHQPIRSLTIPGSSNVYNLLHHHGPAFESELVAYRIYFDQKQTVDIYGKFNKGLEIEACQFYPNDEQLAEGFGDDVLRVSGSGGLGALKGWNGKKALHIEPVEWRTESVLAGGPVRTVVDVDVDNWQYQGSFLNMKIRYILYAGHRDCEVQVCFDRPLGEEIFCAGVQNIKGSQSFYDDNGLVACWGTDWPVNDTIKYAKETVGLATCLPREIVQEKAADGANWLYTLQAKGEKSFTYHISFTSMKETFGYKTPEEWFAHVRRWKEELQHPVEVTIK